MNFEFEAIRPRAISIAAVVWLYLGPSCLVTGLAGGVFLLSAWHLTESIEWLGLLPLYLAGIVGAGAYGIWAALAALRLRFSGRAGLERVNWGMFAGLTLFTLHVAYQLGQVPGYYSTRFDPSQAILPFCAGMVFALPFALLARALRSQHVLFAVRDAEARARFSG